MKTNNYYFPLLFSLTYFLSFYFELDLAGGTIPDLQTHWNFIQKIRDVGLFNILEIETGEKSAIGVDSKLLNFPLHHIIFSQIYFINDNLNAYLNFYFLFSLLVPYLFYLCCTEKFDQIKKTKLVIFSSIILILPNFQSSAIWGNNHNTAIIFFLVAILYLIKVEKNEKQKNIHIFTSYFFLFLATYTKQYYLIFFPIFFLKFFLKFKFNVIPISIISSFLSIPGFIYLANNLGLFKNILFSATNFSSSILVVVSIISIYLIPFFFIQALYDKKYFENLLKRKSFYFFVLIFVVYVFLFHNNFIYDEQIGGGAFIKLNNLIFDNYNFYLFLSILLSIIVLSFSLNSKSDIFLTSLILISFSSGWYIFQKYFEPMYFIVFVLLYDRKLILNLINKNLNLVYYYFSFYWVFYFIYKQREKILLLV